MKKSDSELGMGSKISRRDFIHDSGLFALGLGLSTGPNAGVLAVPTTYYPPTQTGLRGSHPGSYEAAHALARDGKTFTAPIDLHEDYDLVVVGAGISGLAAAYYYRKKFGANMRVLLIENHDDFGGHAQRNEFHQGGEMRLALGGTHNLEHWQFSETVQQLMDELGIDTEDLLRHKEFAYGGNGREGAALWFDRDTYGQDKLVTGCSFSETDPTKLAHWIDSFPITEKSREELKSFVAMRTNIVEGKSEDEVDQFLSSTSYYDFLRQYGGLSEEALQLFDNSSHGSDGLETRNLSVAEGIYNGLPALHLLGEDMMTEPWDYPAAMYPDGNASVARLLVHQLIPEVSPGTNANNVAVAQYDYSQLDRPDSKVRLRLNSTVINATNTDSGVNVTYISKGQTQRVKSRHCIMACYHVIIPHLCPDMPEAQKTAQRYQVKRPLLLTNVLIRSSDAMDQLGIAGADCPGCMHAHVFMFKGINTGGYRHDFADTGPVALTFWGSIAPPSDIGDLKEQMRASRETMLALSFEDYEREVRTVLDGMLGPAGFDLERDILAITVNRWPHGYSHDYLDLWEPQWPPGEAPHEIARQPFGNITIANADAGADAYTHVAIDQAFRAVTEIA